MAVHHSVSSTAVPFSSTEGSHYLQMGERLGVEGEGGSIIHVKRRGLLASTAKCYYGVLASSRPDILTH
jgi:hypothetical protein